MKDKHVNHTELSAFLSDKANQFLTFANRFYWKSFTKYLRNIKAIQALFLMCSIPFNNCI